jgi:protein involved in polysaccharide export with SLBB domain
MAAAVPSRCDAQRADSATGPSPTPTLLRPGDQVRLRIWREPDLSGDFSVDAEGTVVLPQLGPIHVSDQSADSLRADLVRRYAVNLRNPSIEVTVLRQVTIDGAVRKPGIYHVDPTITVAEAIAMAEGVSSDGKQDKVELLRQGETERVSINLPKNARLADTPLSSGDRLYVPQKSWIGRNGGIIAAGISALAVLATTLISQ